MAVNRDKPDRWKDDITRSVDMYNNWLFLCGYFDSGYLGYEAAEGIDWVWEHRIEDFTEYGL